MKTGRRPRPEIKPLPLAKGALLILPDNQPTRDRRLSVLFDLRIPEQAEALHAFRSAFAGQTNIEAVDDVVFVLHVLPGVCSCGEAAV